MNYNNVEYTPSWLFRNGHTNTIYPYLFRPQQAINYTRERCHLPDGDFIDLDWLKNGHQDLVILCHGLEGSSESKYIRHLSLQCQEYKYDVCAVNYRSCSGEINNTANIYHSGATDDIYEVINTYGSDYRQIVLIGFSLGGNLVLKLCGESGNDLAANIAGVVAISVPCDLEKGSYQLLKKQNLLYTNRFLQTLKAKARIKHQQFPDLFDLGYVLASKNVFEFDDRFTGPVHGFKDAIDYYRKCSSKQFLFDIRIPALIINAADDTFLAPECYPFKEAKDNQNIELIVSRYGGHVGFTLRNQKKYWHEVKIEEFLNRLAFRMD